MTLVGLSLVPEAETLARTRELARLADRLGLDHLGIQDHPYQRRFAETWSLLATVLAETERLVVYPNVGNLPLRPPAVMAKTAATLDLLSGGRFVLGLGAGAFWDRIAGYGGPQRTPGEAVDALREAIEVIRLLWSEDRTVGYDGEHYRLKGANPGPRPAHPIGIWLGAYKPRMLRLVGTHADGWVPSIGRMPVDDVRDALRRSEEAAHAAGRDPAAIRRVVNISGTITTPGAGDTAPDERVGSLGGGITGPPEHWLDSLLALRELGIDGFTLWPAEETPQQVELLAGEVAPALRG